MIVRALVLSGFGINCERETAAAFALAGAEARIVHLQRLIRGEVRLDEWDLLALPGGFSYGDDLGSGRVLAAKIRAARLPGGLLLLDALLRFVDDGGQIIGVCNGFQILVKTGLLPLLDGAPRQCATLTRNDSHRFEDRWVRLGVRRHAPSALLDDMPDLTLPVRHGEGKLIFADETVRQRVHELRLDLLRYVDDDGRATQDYPANPNGSQLACAGMCDPGGRILGLMPHPEAALSFYNRPDWPRLLRQQPDPEPVGPGLQLFVNAVALARRRHSPIVSASAADGTSPHGDPS